MPALFHLEHQNKLGLSLWRHPPSSVAVEQSIDALVIQTHLLPSIRALALEHDLRLQKISYLTSIDKVHFDVCCLHQQSQPLGVGRHRSLPFKASRPVFGFKIGLEVHNPCDIIAKLLFFLYSCKASISSRSVSEVKSTSQTRMRLIYSKGNVGCRWPKLYKSS